MNFSQYFDFKNRVISDQSYEKVVNDKEVYKQVSGKYNWWAFFFCGFYALFTNEYKTRGFVKRVWIIYGIEIAFNIVITIAISQEVQGIFSLAEAVFNGYMFNSWYRDQLVENGYQLTNDPAAIETVDNNDFE